MDAEQIILDAFEKRLPEHVTGYVPIFKVRRAAGMDREEFDAALKTLNTPPDHHTTARVQLTGGDPLAHTEDERADSLKWNGTLYLRMRRVRY